MSMRRFMAGATAGLVVAFGAGHTSTLQAQGQGTPIGVDVPFLSQVGAANLLEIRLGQTAEKKASNPGVKQYAHQAVLDHTSMQRQWMTVAKNSRVPFKADLSPAQVEQEKRLNGMSGAEFDRTYMSLTVQNDRENLNAFENERSRVSHPVEVQGLIDQSLITLRNHLTLAQQVGAQVGASDTTSTVVTQPGLPTQNVRADSAFISEVDDANTTELRLARMAGGMAQDPSVKQFAQTMISDHERMQNEWRSLASRNGVRVDGSISPAHQEQVNRLGRRSGTEFDRDYMATMVQNHQASLAAFQTRGRFAQSTEVRQLVDRSLPSLQQHLTLAQQVETQVRTGAPVATPNPQPGQNDEDRVTGDIKSDAQFIQHVGAHHFLQVRLGRLAQKKARDGQVKRFAKTMEDDHSALEKQLSDVAAQNGLKFKSGMGPDNRANLERLEKVSGKSFDRAYMTLMIQTHNAYLNYWRQAARVAQSASLRQYVNAGLPTLEEHMDMAKRIGKRVGVDAEDALVGRHVAAE
jgi:putative membrane protein